MNLRTKTIRCSGFRKRIWDIYNGYHCSIVGTCLLRDELRSLHSCEKDVQTRSKPFVMMRSPGLSPLAKEIGNIIQQYQ